jgi:hypothetical protein
VRARRIGQQARLGGQVSDEPEGFVVREVFLQAWSCEHHRDLLEQERRCDQLEAAVERCVEREHRRCLG